MKKIILLMMMALVTLTACHNNDSIESSRVDAVKTAYNNAFIKTFGQPNPNQTWGFGVVTRGSNPDSQHWGTYPKYPNTLTANEITPITQDEINAVLAVFNQEYTGECTSVFDWDTYFVQHVWRGTAEYTARDGKTKVVGGDKMNWACGYNKKNKKDDKFDNFKPEVGDVMLMTNSSTLRFGYKSEIDNGNVFYYYRMAKVNGQWYVGFDFAAEGNNTNKQIDRDFIYNDWIIKLLPERGYFNPSSVRIIAEDLSASDGTDFDFNDVVFDVNIDGNTAYCTLVAAGGTLPLRINGDDNLEVHKLFGVDVTTMVNTYEGHRNDYAYVNFEVPNITNSANIKIEVNKDGTWMEMTAQRGVPAAKIAVNQDFEYCNEKQAISEKFLNFSNWVQFVDYIWW